ncbi:MAG: Do family serine endopeptidase [Gammaproteobacteria bacterium]|nr:Do family serine endopeptidase [Gammaproteobacteria bacterium]
MRHTLSYIVRVIVLGLAIAFVVTYFWPQLTQQNTATVEIRQTAADSPKRGASGPYTYAAAVDKASPAVVNVNTAKVVSVRPQPFLDDPLFRQFFGDNDELITPRKHVETSLGSGVIMSEQGFILTNHHVIQGADAIQIMLQDGRSAQAKLVGSDPDTDIAVLKINLKKLPVITVGHSDAMHVGDVVLAIGNPFGVGQTVTMGIVSATGRNKLGINTFENFIQTDAAINPGNSGGALIDAEGNLVGINTAIFSRSGGYQGIGFAIPASLASSVMTDILQHGRPLRGWLGMEGQAITPQIARALNLDSTDGVIVAGIVRGGPAHRAGVQPGDIIASIDDKKITEAREALLAISSRKPGDRVKLEVMRNGKKLKLEAVAIERPARAALTE